MLAASAGIVVITGSAARALGYRAGNKRRHTLAAARSFVQLVCVLFPLYRRQFQILSDKLIIGKLNHVFTCRNANRPFHNRDILQGSIY